MQIVTATFRIVTPMFLGGANHEADTIRPPSVKGALRFWWRALNWGRCYEENHRKEAEALKALHAEEAELFGSAKDGGGGEQGCFLLTVKQDRYFISKKDTVHNFLKPTKLKESKNPKSEIDEAHFATARYLGYGLMTPFTSRDKETRAIKKSAGQLDRDCINEGKTFTVQLTFKNDEEPSVITALKMLGLIGGLGSRSRHGLGSIALEKIVVDGMETWITPTTQEEYKTRIRELFSLPPSQDEPPFTAFFKDSRIDILVSGRTPYSVLDDFGKAMLMYRSWGTSNNDGTGGSTVLHQPSEQRFKDDHDWKYSLGPLFPNGHPKRVVFGLPHDYGKYPNQKIKAANHERRSSPLIFHIHQLSPNLFVGVSIFLPAKFLPDGEKIKAGYNDVPANVDWSVNTVITDFLDGKVGNPPTSKDRFPAPPSGSKVQVLP